MKIKLLVGMSGADFSHSPNTDITVSDEEAVALVSSGQAEPKVKKEYATLLEKLEEEKEAQAQKEMAIQAILHKEELEAEKATLEARIAEIDLVLLSSLSDAEKEGKE